MPPAAWHIAAMEELLRTNDPVLLSFAQSLLGDADIAVLVADQNMSIVEGSLGVIPRRLLVPRDRLEEARRILTDADLGRELRG